MNLFRIIPTLLLTIIVLVVVGFLAWNWHRAELRAATATLSAHEAKVRLSDKEKSDAKAEKKALQDSVDRVNHDAQIGKLVDALTLSQQNQLGVNGLIENGFLNRQQYEGRTVQISPDTNIVKAVAKQGRVLEDTRLQLNETNLVVRKQGEQISDLETLLNGADAGISDVRSDVQSYVAERGLLRSRSRRQFRAVDQRLSHVQKGMRKRVVLPDSTK